MSVVAEPLNNIPDKTGQVSFPNAKIDLTVIFLPGIVIMIRQDVRSNIRQTSPQKDIEFDQSDRPSVTVSEGVNHGDIDMGVTGGVKIPKIWRFKNPMRFYCTSWTWHIQAGSNSSGTIYRGHRKTSYT
jgi:hypothetical protein